MLWTDCRVQDQLGCDSHRYRRAQRRARPPAVSAHSHRRLDGPCRCLNVREPPK
ncbi:hypothetical protein ACFPRL_34725 [Pseudoclavibacter helvolus]